MEDDEVAGVLRRIREIREEKGLTFLEASLRTGLSRSMIFYIETGEKNPTLESLARLAQGYEVSLKDFFTSSSNPQQK